MFQIPRKNKFHYRFLSTGEWQSYKNLHFNFIQNENHEITLNQELKRKKNHEVSILM